MAKVLIIFFATIGVICMIGMVLALLAIALDNLNNLIRDWRYNYRIKHRFDKPPTAKCYCRDCRYHDPETRRCYKFHENTNRLTGDASFCWEAEPRERKDEVK